MKDQTVFLLSDNSEHQTLLSEQLVTQHMSVVRCQLAHLEAMLNASDSGAEPEHNMHRQSLVVSWAAPTAELTCLIEYAIGKKCALVILIETLQAESIAHLPFANQYVILPYRSDHDLFMWLKHAKRLRENMDKIEQDIALLHQKLDDRKWIEKAKGTLMKMHRIDEEEAYKALRTSAMKSSQPIGLVAKNIMLTFDAIG
ncbi:ANTAR domain-containing protein [Vibrio sp. S9_S30]|uniref:ANTAR domain-containing response regulator n=1 Tax=Vibrio sp. S9_S30 TaxID=2720226 RepID=UPI0016811CCB|nr:ANTAR domain-containing protein [Vibrio sp. S9_S30]MBD1556409.1 ANTAR domain-containing protein [Vibrio sp. S9_S30]